MAYYPFPNTIYDQPANLLAVLGSWWADAYSGKDQVLDVVQGKSQLENQTMLNLMELIASLSRFTVPIYHTDNWYPLYLKASQRNDANTLLLRYDEGGTYDNGSFYDIPTDRPYSAFPRPADMIEAPLIMNRFTDPTLIQNPEIDYRLVDNAIIFRNNPFDDPRVAQRPLYQDGVQIDTEALLWVYRGQFDWNLIYQQFAYVIGLRLKSSVGYRDLMNAVYDAMVGGPTYADLMKAFSAMTGVPLVQEARETVIDIVTDAVNLIVITDQTVYKFGLNAVPIVAINDVVQRGEALTDALQIHELNCGLVPPGLSSLAIGKGFLATCFYSDLIFEDKNVPLVVTNDPSGYTKVTWSLGGFPMDVEKFFDELHARGVAEAERPIDPCDPPQKTIRYPTTECDGQDVIARQGTLAHYLDKRPAPIGEPTASQLPRTINPLRFLIQNTLRNNAFIVRMKAASSGHNGVGLQNVRLLRKVSPPETAMILIVDLTASPDSVTVDKITERVSTFVGMTPLQDEVVNLVSDRRLTVRVVNGTCQ